ncbi:MAG: hypothetical protein ACON5F_01780 [Jejuia sp.]
MKKIILIILTSITILGILKISYQNKIIHLSYNVLQTDKPPSKSIDGDGLAVFYFGQECFEATQYPSLLHKNEIENLELITITKLLKLSYNIKQDSIEINEHKGVINIIPNDKLFENIFIYEKKNDGILRYPVKWIDQIE